MSICCKFHYTLKENLVWNIYINRYEYVHEQYCPPENSIAKCSVLEFVERSKHAKFPANFWFCSFMPSLYDLNAESFQADCWFSKYRRKYVPVRWYSGDAEISFEKLVISAIVQKECTNEPLVFKSKNYYR